MSLCIFPYFFFIELCLSVNAPCSGFLFFNLFVWHVPVYFLLYFLLYVLFICPVYLSFNMSCYISLFPCIFRRHLRWSCWFRWLRWSRCSCHGSPSMCPSMCPLIVPCGLSWRQIILYFFLYFPFIFHVYWNMNG